MSAASPGQIYVSRTVHDDAGDAFAWEALPALRVKGKAEPVEVYALTGSLARISRRQLRYELPLIGRRAELLELDDRLDEVRTGRGQVVGISAEAGMGKSRLVAEFVRSARRAGLRVAFGECQAFGTTMAYLAWREVWRGLLGVDDAEDPERQRAAVDAALGAIDPGLVARAPLLEAVIGVTIPDNELTAAFDPKLRKASLEDLLSRCLVARADQPLVIVLEDCHWIDELSKGLLEALVRASATLPVLFVLAYRPATSIGGGLGLERLPYFHEVGLSRLDADETGALIRSKLAQLTGTDAEAPESLVSLIAGPRGGQPVLRRGVPELPRRPGDRPGRRAGDRVAGAPEQPPEPDPEPDRSARRGAPADLEGGERRRSRVPGPGAAARLPGDRRPSIRSPANSTSCGPRTSSPSTGRRNRRTSSGTC